MIFIYILNVLLAAATLQVAPTKERLTEEQLAAIRRDNVTPSEIRLKNVKVLLDLYSHEHNGKWPAKWEEIEDEFGPSIWESPVERNQFVDSFALLPGISGSIETRQEGKYDSTLMMVMTDSIVRDFQGGIKEKGRWVLWRTLRGQLVLRWHQEAEITSFSNWPKVEMLIKVYLAARKDPLKNSLPRPTEVPNAQVRTGIPLELRRHTSVGKSISIWAAAGVVIAILAAILWRWRRQ